MHFVGILCLILITTTLFSHLARRMGVPAVIGQLLAGVLLGGAGLNWVRPDILVHDFSEIGVILLMFLAGLESDISLLKRYFRPGMLVALLGIVFPMLFGYATGVGFQSSPTEAFFFGIVLAATSVSISVEVLKELNVVNTKEGSTILGASVVDDILVVLVLSLSLSFLGGESSQATPLPVTLLVELIYFVLIFLLVKWIAPFLMALAEKLFANSAVIIMSLIICLGMAYLADLVGLSSVIGAFFAGIAVSQTKVREEVEHSVEALGYAVFIPVFFVSVGLEVDFSRLNEQLFFILAFTVVAILTKLVGGYVGAKIAKFSNNSAWMVGAGMISRGEMALIILQIGQQNQLISSALYSPLVIVVLLSTLISPLILKYFTKKIY
ncbi:cation:proton antiporter [Enterococcus casseliflavus]|uniref:cation:proton antiporter n=1 Tax=Enterococcus casseliflavus TaxID=37734 RepID=UPI00129CFBA7|nr:monovalent cation:proton antiporter-2 (CPA2) family protein [Enterococcus casseliflavus]MRI70143.1 sodium:proton antiporter [Enterococcus casseliflavus]MUN73693.1 sodium:proton antiporter [Enterococcus casseliflavus]MUN96832.1 sodium:proton antiporter [Enterococcus casseliflavus]